MERGFEIGRCGVALHRVADGPIVLVDNFGANDDAYRLATVCPSTYRHGPLYSALGDPDACRFASLARDLGATGELGHPLVLPIFDPTGMIGTIQCGGAEPYSRALLRDLGTTATQVSVRLTQLGVSAVDGTPARLTARQHEAARLAARGATNPEIATALGITTNTVKKLLKLVFARLDLDNRVALARTLPQIAPPLAVPLGITWLGSLAITRGE